MASNKNQFRWSTRETATVFNPNLLGVPSTFEMPGRGGLFKIFEIHFLKALGFNDSSADVITMNKNQSEIALYIITTVTSFERM